MIIYWKYISNADDDNNWFIYERDTINRMERCVYDPNDIVSEDNKNWTCWTSDTIKEERNSYPANIIKLTSKTKIETSEFIEYL